MTLILGKLQLDMDIEVDTITGKVTVKRLEQEFISREGNSYTHEFNLHPTDYNYSILRIPGRSELARALPKGDLIKLEYEGNQWEVRCNQSITGRLDRMKAVYTATNLEPDMQLVASYYPETKTIILKAK